MLEKTEVTIKNGQSRVTGNIGYTRHRTKTNQANQKQKQIKYKKKQAKKINKKKIKKTHTQHREIKRWATRTRTITRH